MKSAKKPFIPIKTIEIPYIHPKLQLSHLRENGKLFSDSQIQAVQENVVIQNTQGRITKAKLNDMFAAEINNKTLEPFAFSLQRTGDTYNAIYKGQEFSLGSGNFGSVKLLQNLATKETSEVLKVLKTATDADVAKEKLGLQKAQQFKSLSSRKNQFEIVMDAAKGCSLDKLIGKKLPTVVWIDIIINVLKEMKTIHSNNLLHRDLKPENINYDLITKKATVLDFGLAIPHTSKKEILFANLGLSTNSPTDNLIRGTQEFPIGTVKYMSYETQQGIYNESTDIHALGLTFANLLDMSSTERKYFRPTGETDEFLKVKSPAEVAGNSVIMDDLTRGAILQMLTDMTNSDNKLTLTNKPGYTNIIDYFSRIREEYIDTLGLTHNIAYLNISDYLNADENSKKVMLSALKNTDEVWLLDINGDNQTHYLAIQKALEYQGINVSYSVIQADENNVEQVMHSYAEQREVNDRNIYECSYLTRTGQLAQLSAGLNDSQVQIIVTSLQEEINSLNQKYKDVEAKNYIEKIKLTITTLQHTTPISLHLALQELDKLQVSMLAEPESQNHIKKLMLDLENTTSKKTYATAKGFDAAMKEKNSNVVLNKVVLQEEKTFVENPAERLALWKETIPTISRYITDNKTLNLIVKKAPEQHFEELWNAIEGSIESNISNFNELRQFHNNLPPAYQQRLMKNFENYTQTIRNIEALDFFLDKLPTTEWGKVFYTVGNNAQYDMLKLTDIDFESLVVRLQKNNLLEDMFLPLKTLMANRLPQAWSSPEGLIELSQRFSFTTTQLNAIVAALPLKNLVNTQQQFETFLTLFNNHTITTPNFQKLLALADQPAKVEALRVVFPEQNELIEKKLTTTAIETFITKLNEMSVADAKIYLRDNEAAIVKNINSDAGNLQKLALIKNRDILDDTFLIKLVTTFNDLGFLSSLLPQPRSLKFFNNALNTLGEQVPELIAKEPANFKAAIIELILQQNFDFKNSIATIARNENDLELLKSLQPNSRKTFLALFMQDGIQRIFPNIKRALTFLYTQNVEINDFCKQHKSEILKAFPDESFAKMYIDNLSKKPFSQDANKAAMLKAITEVFPQSKQIHAETKEETLAPEGNRIRIKR